MFAMENISSPRGIADLNKYQLGIRTGSKIAFEIVDDHIEMNIQSTPAQISSGGFGMLKTRLIFACVHREISKICAPGHGDPVVLNGRACSGRGGLFFLLCLLLVIAKFTNANMAPQTIKPDAI